MENRKLAITKYAAAAVLGVGLSVFCFKTCSVLLEHQPARQEGRRPHKAARASPAPEKACEPSKGEADPASPNFDITNCGFCGDGIRQGWEDATKCRADFTCGNGTLESKAKLPAYRMVEGKLVMSEREVTETCAHRSPLFCAADCPTYAPAPSCPDKTLIPILVRTTDRLLENRAVFREPVSAGGGDVVFVALTGRVSNDGRLSGLEITASKRPEGYVLLPEDAAALIRPPASLRLPSPGEECTFSVPIAIPADKVNRRRR